MKQFATILLAILSASAVYAQPVSVYISNAGSDTNDGLSEQSPKRTVRAGIRALANHNGTSHWLLLERGSRWDRNDEGGTDWRWNTHGSSATERCGVASYGDPALPRPVLENGALWYGAKARPLKHFDVRGIEFYHSGNDPESPKFQSVSVGHRGLFIGVELEAAKLTEDIVVDDCVFRFMNVGSAVYSQTNGIFSKTVSFTNNHFIDCRQWGLMINSFSQSVVDGNRFIRCGWDKRTVKLHAAYLSDCDHCVVTDNLFLNSGNWGLKFSSNSKNRATNFHILNNVFYGGGLGLGHSQMDNSWNPLTEFTHVDGIVSGNLFSQSVKDFPAGSGSFQSIAINIGNLDNVTFADNIFAHNQPEAGGGELFRFASPTVEISQRITLSGNRVHNWASKSRRTKGTYFLNLPPDTIQIDNLTETHQYADPSRGVESYATTRGQTLDQLADDAPVQASEILDYVRTGFVVTGTTSPEPEPEPEPLPEPEPDPKPEPTPDPPADSVTHITIIIDTEQAKSLAAAINAFADALNRISSKQD